jgi:hypothetical protein
VDFEEEMPGHRQDPSPGVTLISFLTRRRVRLITLGDAFNPRY